MTYTIRLRLWYLAHRPSLLRAAEWARRIGDTDGLKRAQRDLALLRDTRYGYTRS